MKQVLTFNGSPRKNGNTSNLLSSFFDGIGDKAIEAGNYFLHDANLKFCTGCLRCNILGYCSLRDDDWQEISDKIDHADILVFATPVYFHHVTAPMKVLLDRFRSFIKIRITESGLDHQVRKKWDKDLVLLLSMGSSDDSDAKPIIELFEFMVSIMGEKSRLHVMSGTRLAVSNQVSMDKDKLAWLYEKMELDPKLAKDDAKKNYELLQEAFKLGESLVK